MLIDVRSINFGRDTAERDEHLADYFLQTSSYERVRSGSKSILIGRKGTGKTALLKYFVSKENTSQEYVIPIEATHATYTKIDETLKSFQTTAMNLDSSFKLGWLFTTLLSLVDRVTREAQVALDKDEATVYQYAVDHMEYTPSDPISSMATYAKDWVRNLKKIGPIERDTSSNSTPVTFDETRLLEMIRKLISKINSKQKIVYLFYDKIDERWDGSELYIHFIQGLLLATHSLNELQLKLRPVVLLRDDIFEAATTDFQHIDHYRMDIERIAWDEESLVKLVALRIQNSLERQHWKYAGETDVDMWHLLFEKEVPYKKSPIPVEAYMIERTLFRPRDIILFANYAKSKAEDSKHEIVNIDNLRKAEKQYSNDKYRDLQAEVSYRFPQIKLLLETFRRKTAGFDNEAIRLHLLEAQEKYERDFGPWLQSADDKDILKLLYDIGFICYTEKGGVLRGTRVVNSASQPDAEAILDCSRVFISPIFRKALDVRDH